MEKINKRVYFPFKTFDLHFVTKFRGIIFFVYDKNKLVCKCFSTFGQSKIIKCAYLRILSKCFANLNWKCKLP